MAARLIGEFGSLAATLAASPERLAKACGSDTAEKLGAIRQAILHSCRVDLVDRPLLAGSAEVAAFLRANLAHLRSEHVAVLFLTAGNRLIADEVMFRGGLRSVPLGGREITARALELDAAAVIVAHNHPSGDPTPSSDDIRSTRTLVDQLRSFDIVLLDHIVIARSGEVSFHARGLL